MPGLLPNIDPDGLLEFSVVYTDRALNHMSKRFQGVMTDISAMLKRVYKGPSAVLVPGSGTFGMESVARQFATGQHVMVIRNGWFSFRWTQIFDMGQIPKSHTVLKARRVSEAPQAAWTPALRSEASRTEPCTVQTTREPAACNGLNVREPSPHGRSPDRGPHRRRA